MPPGIEARSHAGQRRIGRQRGKSEGRKKVETRRPKPESPSAPGFGLRISELGLLSALGLRTSGFGLQSYHTLTFSLGGGPRWKISLEGNRENQQGPPLPSPLLLLRRRGGSSRASGGRPIGAPDKSGVPVVVRGCTLSRGRPGGKLDARHPAV